MAAKRGQPSSNPAGRPKGSANKFTKDIKQACLDAFAEGGGKEWLKKQMKSEPRAFMALLGKILPTEIKAEIQVETQTVVIDFTGLPALNHGGDAKMVVGQVIDPLLEATVRHDEVVSDAEFDAESQQLIDVA